MNFKDRLFVNMKSTNFKLLILMTVFYGIIFGGISQIGNMFNGKLDIKALAFTILANTIIYGLMFLIILIIIYNVQSIKMMLVIGMSRKNLIKCWIELHVYILLIAVTGVSIVLLISQFENSSYLSYRMLDVDFNNLGGVGFLKVLIMIVMLFATIIGILNLVAQIGNHYGWRWVLNMVIGLVGCLLLVMPRMITVIVWGQGYWLMFLILTVITSMTFFLSYRLVNKMEVKR
jgi:hypothetical protein